MNVLRNHNIAKLSVIGLASLGALSVAHEVGGCGGNEGIIHGTLIPGLGAGTSESLEVSSESAIDDIHPEGQYMIAQAEGMNKTELAAKTKINLGLFHPTIPFTRRSVWVKRHEDVQVMLRSEALSLHVAKQNGKEVIEADVAINPTAKHNKDASLYTQHVNSYTIVSGGDSEFFAFPTLTGTVKRTLNASDLADLKAETDCRQTTLPAAPEGVKLITRALLRAKSQVNNSQPDARSKAIATKQKLLANGEIIVKFVTPQGQPYDPYKVYLPTVEIPKDSQLQKSLGEKHHDLLNNSVHLDNSSDDNACRLNPGAVQQTVDLIMKSRPAGATPSTTTPGV
jgi:hypothetical protein